MSDPDTTHDKPDPNEHEIDPPPTSEERELARLMLEYTRNHPPQKEAAK